MDFDQEFLLLAVAMLATGVAGGVLAGLLGIGGGIVVVPMLEWALELVGVPTAFRMHIAVGTSLAVIIPTAVSSARAHHMRGAVDVDLARRWTFFIFAGAALGAFIASKVGGPVLSGVFAVIALLVAIKMVLPLDDRVLVNEVPHGGVTGIVPVTIGAISTMMGIGGGSMSVPALTLMGEPIHKAVGTSALFGLLIAVPGAIGFIAAGWNQEGLPPGSLGFVSVVGLALIAPATVIAAPLGARIAHALSHRSLTLFFGLFLLVAATRMIYQTINA